MKELNYFNQLIKDLNIKFPNIENNVLTYQMLRMSISKMINDIIKESLKNINSNNIKSIDDIKNFKSFLINMSKNMKNECKEIRSYLYTNVYNHPKLLEKRSKSEKIIFKLFYYYEKNFEKLPNDWLLRSESDLKQRIICDYISGMTDRFASKLYGSIYE